MRYLIDFYIILKMFFVKNYWDGLGMNYSESFWHTVFRVFFI